MQWTRLSQTEIGCEDRLWNDLYCVGWGVKLYSLTHSWTERWEKEWEVNQKQDAWIADSKHLRVLEPFTSAAV